MEAIVEVNVDGWTIDPYDVPDTREFSETMEGDVAMAAGVYRRDMGNADPWEWRF